MNRWTAIAASMVLGALVVAAAVPVHAEDEAEPRAKTGFYLGGGLGGASWDSFDDGSFAWRAQIWYRVCDYFSAELEWLDLDHSDGTYGAVTHRVAVDGFNVSAVPMLPLGDFTLFGKVGAYLNFAEYHGTGGNDSSQDLSYGAGATYDFNDRFGLRAEWTRLELELQANPAAGFPGENEPVDAFTFGGYLHY